MSRMSQVRGADALRSFASNLLQPYAQQLSENSACQTDDVEELRYEIRKLKLEVSRLQNCLAQAK